MLTAEQIAERKEGIGASDAAKIISGDWYDLWAEKTSRKESEDLSGVWPVQLGSITETLNLDWYARKTGHEVVDRGQALVSPEHPFLRCNLDGFDAVDKIVIEAKHCNGFTKIEDARERYFPQVQHQMIVTGARKAVLSVIIGAAEPVLEYVDFDPFWANEYIEKAKEFWGFVVADKPPPGGKAMNVAPAAPDKMREVDMAGNNAFAAGAADWLKNVDASKTFKKSEVTLKELMEPDMKRAHGHGIEILRQKTGLKIKALKEGK